MQKGIHIVSLQHILLGILQEPKSGYDVKKLFDEIFSNFWAAELSQIYPQLKKLSEKGKLSVTEEESAKGPNKKVKKREWESLVLAKVRQNALRTNAPRLNVWIEEKGANDA